jgi:thymidylate synthase ThyX
MRVIQTALRATPATEKANRPALTPELLAATGARYSRSNEGLEAILAKIDPKDLDKSVDSIFRMIDYGHQSIADMAPVAMFIDGVSIWLAYYIWTLCPTAGGQESSTRYIKLSLDGLVPPTDLGLPEADRAEWSSGMAECFQTYQRTLEFWEAVAVENPALTGIPKSLLEDPSDKAQKKVARMRRNFSFDRARYFLPSAVATNVMLIMSARAWVILCQHLLSHPLHEARLLGAAIRAELELCVPRMVKHACVKESVTAELKQDFDLLQSLAGAIASSYLDDSASAFDHPPVPAIQVMVPPGITGRELGQDLAFHDNRYAGTGPHLRRTAVRFGWEAVAFAEVRDLNRHRTGTKYCPLAPVGFYCATDQLPAQSKAGTEVLKAVAEVGRRASAKALSLLRRGDPAYVYWMVLGTQVPFEHVTTANMFIYEAELRTGVGAHYRYAKHLRDVLALWYKSYPETKGLILEGSAEPE